jgi:hypothetical protein
MVPRPGVRLDAQVPARDSSGTSQRRPSLVLKAFGAQVIGSTATLRRHCGSSMALPSCGLVLKVTGLYR